MNGSGVLFVLNGNIYRLQGRSSRVVDPVDVVSQFIGKSPVRLIASIFNIAKFTSGIFKDGSTKALKGNLKRREMPMT